MSFPGQSNEEESHEILDQFVAAGGNFLDTADMYSVGLSETIIGTWLAKHPELRKKIIIATKLFCPLVRDDPNCAGLSRHHIMEAVENSLKRLQTNYIDLYQVIDCVSYSFLAEQYQAKNVFRPTLKPFRQVSIDFLMSPAKHNWSMGRALGKTRPRGLQSTNKIVLKNVVIPSKNYIVKGYIDDFCYC